MSEIIVFVGPQGSGKSTYYRRHFADTHALVSKDLFRHNRNRERRQANLIRAAIAEGRPVVVDNTSPTAATRLSVVQLAAELGVPAAAYWFTAPLADCLRRNAAREGRARVPDGIVAQTHQLLEPPTSVEGWVRIYTVETTEDAFITRQTWPA